MFVIQHIKLPFGMYASHVSQCWVIFQVFGLICSSLLKFLKRQQRMVQGLVSPPSCWENKDGIHGSCLQLGLLWAVTGWALGRRE